LAGAVLGWARSGEAIRSSFALLRSARTLGVLDSPWDGLARLWYLLPLAVGLVWLAGAVGRWRSAGLLAVAVGLGAAGAVFAVVRSPLPVLAGVTVAAVGAVVSVVAGLTLVARGR
jgi:hypothetical protein